jgi:hypothetical protein
VRRIRGILALVMAVLAIASPASAHPALEDPYVPVGRPVTIVLGVPSEEWHTPLTEVDVTMPAEFRFAGIAQTTPGWQGTASGNQLRFTGSAPEGQYVQFTLNGTFVKKKVLMILTTVISGDGTTRRYNDFPTRGSWPAALVFPGYPRGEAPIPGVNVKASPSISHRLATRGPWALLAVPVLACAYGVVRARRRLAER